MGVVGGGLAADVDEKEGMAAGEDVVGGPLERVLAAPVAVDGDGGRPRAAPPRRERGAVPHGGVGGVLAGVLLLRRRDDGLRVERVRHLRAGLVVAEEEDEGMASMASTNGQVVVVWWWDKREGAKKMEDAASLAGNPLRLHATSSVCPFLDEN